MSKIFTAPTAVVCLFLAMPVSALAVDDVCGDVNQSGTLTATDALFVLRAAVGQSVDLQCAAGGGVLQTGQITCYDASGGVIDCAGTSQDAQLRAGAAHTFTDNGDGTITDSATGLTWEKLSNDGSVHDYDDNVYTWQNAFLSKIDVLNQTNFAGHNDWRLPNLNELESIRNLGTSSPAIYAAFNTGCTAGCTVTECSCTIEDAYWTSTSYDPSPEDAWTVYFDDGDTYEDGKLVPNYVRAVRGGL